MKYPNTFRGKERSKEAIAFLEAVAEVSRQHGFVFWIETQDEIVVTRAVSHDPTDPHAHAAPTIEAQSDIGEFVETE